MGQINTVEFAEKVLGEYYKDSFYGFLKDYFKYIKNLPFKPHYTTELVAEYLEANIKGDIEWLLLSLPRGWGKSILVSEFGPAWALIRDPMERLGCFSRAFTEDAKGWHQTSLEILQHPLTNSLFKMKIDGSNKTIFRTAQGGYRRIGSCLASSVGSDLTMAFVDDPVDQEHYRSEAKQARINNFFKKSLFRAIRTVDYNFDNEDYTDQLTEEQKAEIELTKQLEAEAQALKLSKFQHKKPRLCVTMQRLSCKDPISMILEIKDNVKQAGMDDSKIAYLPIPAYFEEVKTYVFPISQKQYTAKAGEYLEAGTLSKLTIQKARIEMLEDDFQAQMQQNPPQTVGTFFQKEWIRYVDNIALVRFDSIYLSFDTAFKTDDYNDPTACVVFGVANGGRDFYVIESLVKKMEFVELEQTTKALIDKYRIQTNIIGVLIEDKGSGQSLIQNLKRTINNIIPIRPEGSKEMRLHKALTGMKITLESGNFYLPKNASWRVKYENELLSFPNVIHDDQIDATSQFFNWYSQRKLSILDVL